MERVRPGNPGGAGKGGGGGDPGRLLGSRRRVRVREQSARRHRHPAGPIRNGETATAWAATVTQQAADRTATATAQAWQQTATATAHAPTATAEHILFELSVQKTRDAWEVTRQAMESTLHAQETAQAAQAEQDRLEAERARLVYPVRAYGPWALLFTAFALLLWAGYRMTRAAEASGPRQYRATLAATLPSSSSPLARRRGGH